MSEHTLAHTFTQTVQCQVKRQRFHPYTMSTTTTTPPQTPTRTNICLSCSHERTVRTTQRVCCRHHICSSKTRSALGRFSDGIYGCLRFIMHVWLCRVCGWGGGGCCLVAKRVGMVSQFGMNERDGGSGGGRALRVFALALCAPAPGL